MSERDEEIAGIMKRLLSERMRLSVRVSRLEIENDLLRAALESGCDLGLAPDECRAALSSPAPAEEG